MNAQHLIFPQALIQGALVRLGMPATVHRGIIGLAPVHVSNTDDHEIKRLVDNDNARNAKYSTGDVMTSACLPERSDMHAPRGVTSTQPALFDARYTSALMVHINQPLALSLFWGSSTSLKQLL